MKPSIMLIGLGNLGNVVLQFLSREKRIGRIVICTRNKNLGIARCNLARLGALIQGHSPSISFSLLDITDKEGVIETVDKEKPDIILLTASMLTWWLPDLLPTEQAKVIKGAGFGVWLPVHLTLALKLMEALYESDYRGITLTAPFPDVINCILDRINLTPTCGIGNLDEIIPKVRLLTAKKLSVSVNDVQVFLVAHHSLESKVFNENKEESPPYFLRIEHEGEDVTESLDGDKLLFAPYPLPPGLAIHYLTAGCTARLVKALSGDDEVLLHAPAPNGLPGGYPILASRKGVQVAPIQGLTLEEAIHINERSHRFDGIEKIEADGSVVFCRESAEILRNTLGYDCQKLSPGDAEGRAEELIARFREYAHRYGVDI